MKINERKLSSGPISPKPYMEKVLTAFTRRRRAIKRHLAHFSVEIVLEKNVLGKNSERQLLRIEAQELPPRPTCLELIIWEDSRIWLSIRRPNIKRIGGWLFLEVLSGRVDALDPSEIVQAFEKTLFVGTSASSDECLRSRIEEIWKGLLD